jgi:hypothetical protein
VYLSAAARELLTPDATPARFLKALADANLAPDAFSVIAFLLPTRLRVWWGCLCIRGVGPAELEPPARANFEAVVRWVRDPSEVNRSAAEAAADASGMGTLGFRLARSVAIARSEPRRSAELIVESLVTFAALPPAHLRQAVCRQFIAFGIDLDRGAVTLPPPVSEAGRA